MVRLVFLDPAARDTFPDFDGVAQETVATLRAPPAPTSTTRGSPSSSASCRSRATSSAACGPGTRCARRRRASKRMLHPMVGELVLGYETLRVNDAPEQLVVGYHAEPGSASEQALALLGAMAAEQAIPAVATTA